MSCHRLRCPRDAKFLKFDGCGKWTCRCGFTFTDKEWQEAPHQDISEFLYDLSRGRVTKTEEN